MPRHLPVVSTAGPTNALGIASVLRTRRMALTGADLTCVKLPALLLIRDLFLVA